ncbi:pleiotropic ABC efflux transporter of multiple drugs [Monosporozyma servazzii]
MSLRSDMKDNTSSPSVSSKTSSADSTEHPYQGFGRDAEDKVRDLARTITSQSIHGNTQDNQSVYSSMEGINPVFSTVDKPGYNEKLDPTSEYFSSVDWVKNMAKIAASDPEYYKPYSLGCVWKDLTAAGESSDVAYQPTVLNMPQKMLSAGYNMLRPPKEEDLFQILKPMHGYLDPGELMVVLGRPGSGCSTFLKSISSNTHGFNLGKDSVISYSGLSPEDIKKHYRGEVVYNAETDIHLPHLTVFQTLFTVACLKTPQNRVQGVDREAWARHVTEVAMATYGLSHTRNTKVGDDLVRGVSGGERKRVSIAEVAICGSKFQCWDNATRGLDSATALEFIRALKTQATIANAAATVAIYQCSQDAYDLFDKVCVLDGGYQIFYGSSAHAKEYFEKMGYVSPDRQTTADFLTAITSPAERIINPEYIKKGIPVPQTPKDMYDYWVNSPEYKQLLQEVDERIANHNDENREVIKEAHIAKQSKRARPGSSYTVSYGLQIKYILRRNLWRMRNNAGVPLFMIFGNSAIALILGSGFYKVMKRGGTGSFYFRGAAMFVAILFNAFSCLLEIFSLYEARPITEKHKRYSLYHPSADAFASVISEIPVKAIVAICFNIIFYFLVDFRRNGGAFFFYLLINIVAVFAMSHLFRTVGSLTKTLSEAMVPASILLLAMSMFTGFAIPRTKMLGWSTWIWYINPLSYLFESAMINEFHNVRFDCSLYVPNGPAYSNIGGTDRICSTVGAVPGQSYVLGDDYIKGSYDYEHKHKWRGFGVGMAFVVFFFWVYLFVCEFNEGAKQKGEILVFPASIIRQWKKEGKIKSGEQNTDDIEKNVDSSVTDGKMLDDDEDFQGDAQEEVGLSKSEAVFHWRNLCYDVQIKDETRRILNNVDGWVKPGTLTALMGSSGAGKTTLLDCLAERVTMGVITGDVLVDGIPRSESFPRSIGYCQQQDLHLRTSTVRESLRFSAYLRQPKEVPVSEKNAYVEEVIKILEMEKYADAVVGVTGEGLNVEQRKRLTIGVELAAKPKLLVFLDEPTSGLDSQTAWAICQLMRKLANHGQAILCTIHQPSAILMQEFDRLLFLQKGGKTVYFGDLGEGCQTLIDYFESHGSHKCPPSANPAEWMLEVVGAAPGSHANQDYHEVWRASEEFKAVHAELDHMERDLPAKHSGESEVLHEFATDLITQTKLVTIRLFQQYWRSPEYLWSKFFLTIIDELFIGFTFFKADRSMQGLQNQMLSIFMFVCIFNPLLQQYLPNFVQQRDLYEARERPSRTFSWKAFIFAQIFAEVPWNILAGTIAYFIYYYPVGFYSNASYADQLHERGALFWLFSTAFFVYVSSTGLLVISFNEVDANAANLASLAFTMALSFCGVMVTKDGLPRFWIFMYRVSPLTYLVDGMLSIGVANVPITCGKNEYLKFTPANNMTCAEYMKPYLETAGTGYLQDPQATDECSFCQYSSTNDYLATVGCSYDNRWRNWGIFICYIAFNYLASILFYYLARVPKSFKVKKQ